MDRDPIFAARKTFRSENFSSCSHSCSHSQYWWEGRIFTCDRLPMDSQDPEWNQWTPKLNHPGRSCWHEIDAEMSAIRRINLWISLSIIAQNLKISPATILTYLSWIDNVMRILHWFLHTFVDNLTSVQINRHFDMLPQWEFKITINARILFQATRIRFIKSILRVKFDFFVNPLILIRSMGRLWVKNWCWWSFEIRTDSTSQWCSRTGWTNLKCRKFHWLCVNPPLRPYKTLSILTTHWVISQ
jgi:hypothetical protein